MKNLSITITTGSFIRGLLLLALVGLLYYLRDIVMIVLTAIVIASSVEPAIHGLMRRGISRLFAVIITYAVIVAAFAAIIFLFVPPVLDDTAGFLQGIPAQLTSINISDATHGLLPLGSIGDTISSADILKNITSALADSTGGALTTISAFFGGLASFVLIFVFAIYFSVQETGVDDFLRIVSPVKHQVYILNLWKRSQEKIGKWMQGQIVLALIVGVLLYLGLTILGVPYALLLAVLAAFFELIPIFGQIMAAVPAVVIGFGHGGLTEALLIAGLYLVVQQFESHLIYPIVVKKVVGIPPLIVIIALLVGYKLLGFLGVLISVPIAGAVQELVSDISESKKRAMERLGLAGREEEA
ncbi:MAG TPA: AI-2E family transporter [Candidatus Paceibacterota bacterium]|nr:AI-2E family transporter [Candidatus Paceibacterota bacterium]